MANKVYYGPVYFRRESEPYMTLAMAGTRRDYGVIVAEVNLKSIWDTISQIKVGERGQAYVVDEQARLIAHPDISLVLRNTDLSHLAQIQAARSGTPQEQEQAAENLQGLKVLSAHARVAPLDWLVFVEMPLNEAYAPLYASILRAGAFLGGALIVAVFAGMLLARRMVIPIRALRDGAVRIGSGDLSQRISIKTGDELEALGNQFNSMAAKLQESYATLERKVEERTHQLELANLAKSRFLATASHDLRQPLHALGLFAAQLRHRASGHRASAEERGRIVERINAAVAAMNELFNALLDISKLDAGALAPNITEFPVAHVLKRIESTFAGAAREKHLSLRFFPCDAWVRSDSVLLERILLNLVSNAVRYTAKGGVIVGCRRRGDQLRIEVWDTGTGIPQDQREIIFGEFYRLRNSGADDNTGLGLGLAIVDRLCGLLGHSIELTSAVGKGSRFAVLAPLVPSQAIVVEPPMPIHAALDASSDKLIVVLDDDPLVLDGMGGLLRSWGCRVISGDSVTSALNGLAEHDQASRPDHFRLPSAGRRNRHRGHRAAAPEVRVADLGVPHQWRHPCRAAARSPRRRLSLAAQAGGAFDAPCDAQPDVEERKGRGPPAIASTMHMVACTRRGPKTQVLLAPSSTSSNKYVIYQYLIEEMPDLLASPRRDVRLIHPANVPHQIATKDDGGATARGSLTPGLIWETVMQTTSRLATIPATDAVSASEKTIDEALLASIATGDKRAMERLFERHNRWIYHFLYNITGSASLAEEMLSDVFLAVWREASSFEPKSSVSTWLLAIARHRAIETLRLYEGATGK